MRLSWEWLEEAELEGTRRLEGAELGGKRLEGAELGGKRLEGADEGLGQGWNSWMLEGCS